MCMFKAGDEVDWFRYGRRARGVIRKISWLVDAGSGRSRQVAHVTTEREGTCFFLLSDLQHVSDVVALSRAASCT